jgi:hypothetical protein
VLRWCLTSCLCGIVPVMTTRGVFQRKLESLTTCMHAHSWLGLVWGSKSLSWLCSFPSGIELRIAKNGVLQVHRLLFVSCSKTWLMAIFECMSNLPTPVKQLWKYHFLAQIQFIQGASLLRYWRNNTSWYRAYLQYIFNSQDPLSTEGTCSPEHFLLRINIGMNAEECRVQFPTASEGTYTQFL